MLSEIWFLANYNLYESKQYFSARFAEAFRRKGINARIFDTYEDKWFEELNQRSQQSPDLVCTFHRTFPQPSGEFWWDMVGQPFLTMLVDPAVQYIDLVKSKYGAVSCVDHFDCDFLRGRSFENVFFLGHAVERELDFEPRRERPYDVVFIGSSYDPESLRAYWSQTLPKEISPIVDAACDITLSDPKIPHWRAILNVAAERNIKLVDVNLRILAYFVDVYTRGLDRLEMIRSIKNAPIHIFGGTVESPIYNVRGWEQLLAQQSNVVLHPAMPFSESLEILKQSKICLNSMPFFRNGTHERLFTGLACGALPISTDNLWIQDHFIDGEEVATYQSTQWNTLNEKVDFYLANETVRAGIVDRGREKVMKFHTWDNRVEEMMAGLDSLQNWPQK